MKTGSEVCLFVSMMVISLDRLRLAEIHQSMHRNIVHPRIYSSAAATRIIHFSEMGTFRDKNSLVSGTVNFAPFQAQMTRIVNPKLVKVADSQPDVKAA